MAEREGPAGRIGRADPRPRKDRACLSSGAGKAEEEAPPPPTPVQEDVSAQQYSLKLNCLAKSSDGLRMQPDPAVRATLPGIVEPLANSPVETIDPLPLEYSDAAPAMERFNEVQQWVLARREVGPIGRHGLYVLE